MPRLASLVRSKLFCRLLFTCTHSPLNMYDVVSFSVNVCINHVHVHGAEVKLEHELEMALE